MTHRTPANDKTELYRANWAPEKSEPEIEPGAVWGRITCVDAQNMPPKRDYTKRLPIGFWTPLVEELFLRLNCTPSREALRIPFASKELARRAYHAVRLGFRDRYGGDLIDLRRDESVLFIRRSSTWRMYNERSSAEK